MKILIWFLFSISLLAQNYESSLRGGQIDTTVGTTVPDLINRFEADSDQTRSDVSALINKILPPSKDSIIWVNFGDSNTFGYSGADEAPDVTYTGWENYSAMLNLEFMQIPFLFDALIYKQGYSGYTASQGNSIFSNVSDKNPDYVVISFGTNEIRGSSALSDYLASMDSLIDSVSNVNAICIVLGIPYNDATLASKLELWNSGLEKLCLSKGVQFVDTYELTKYEPYEFFVETTNKRHYSHIGAKKVAELIADKLYKEKIFYNDDWDSTRVAEIFYASKDSGYSVNHKSSGYIFGDTTNAVRESFMALNLATGDTLSFKGVGKFELSFYQNVPASVQIRYKYLSTNNVEIAVADTLSISAYAGNIYNADSTDPSWIMLRKGFNQYNRYFDCTIKVLSGTAFLNSIGVEKPMR